MKRVLAPAAPARLREAAKAGAGRLSSLCARQARERSRALVEWSRLSRQCGWIAECKPLRRGPIFGLELERYCAGGSNRRTERPAKPPPKPCASPVESVADKARPSYAKPRKVAPTPHVESCEAAKAMPARAGAGRLRLWAGSDEPAPPRRKPGGKLRRVPSRAPCRLPSAQGEGQTQWLAALAKRTTLRRSRPPDPSTILASALARPLSGEEAPLSLLQRAAAPGRQQDTTLPADQLPMSRAATLPVRGTMPSHPQGDPALRANADLSPIAAPGRRSADPGKSLAPFPSAAGAAKSEWRAAEWHDRQRSDPLFGDTIGPPRHRTRVPLPPQPDLAAPFAEIIPLESRSALTRAQGAVADEPLAELPPPPAPVALHPRLDRYDLGDALAEVLRAEARRHGIDV